MTYRRGAIGPITALAFALALAACGSHDSGSGGGGGGGDASFGSIVVSPATATVSVDLGSSATQSYSVMGTVNGQTEDITSQCELGVDPSFGTAAGAIVTVGPHGGVATVTATCGGQLGSAQLTVDVTGTVITGSNTPASAPGTFGSASAGSNTANDPLIQYPIDQAVAPLNIPSVEFQWAASGNDLFHISLQSTYLTIDVYTSDLQSTLSDADWHSVAQSVAGTTLTITVEGLLQASPQMKFASAPTTLHMSFDTIDTSAIYYWASNEGDIMSSTFGSTSAPTPVEGNCSGCHALSKAGSRIGYCRCVGGDCGQEWVGFLHFNPTTNGWDEVVNADNEQIHGTYTTFSPVGNPFPDDSQALALVTSNAGVFGLYDPDTGSAVSSNVATQSVMDPATGNPGTQAALMPDWSADGTQIVFASTPHPGQSVDISDSQIATMSYAYGSGSNIFGNPKYLVTTPITLPSGTYDNLFFPSFSPDDQYVVFDAARAPWRDLTAGQGRTPGQRLMIVKPDGTGLEELALLNGSGDNDVTWPHWAPGNTSDYYWVAFSTERDYGHEITSANTNSACVENGMTQCKQIWIGAVSKAALAAGSGMDPSSPPMWLPGQDTQADNISPYWTVPAGLQ